MKKASHGGVRSPTVVLPQIAGAHAHSGAGWVWVDCAPDAAAACPIVERYLAIRPQAPAPLASGEGQRTRLSFRVDSEGLVIVIM